MKFKSEDLRDLVDYEKSESGLEIVKDEISGSSRWARHYELIFSLEGELYGASYRRGATECQDESPFEYDGEFIECPEMEAVEVTVTEYREKP